MKKSSDTPRNERRGAGKRAAVAPRSGLAGILSSPVKTAFVVAAIAFLVYANTLGHGFVWDDLDLIEGNPRMGEFTAGDLGAVFTSNFWNGYQSGGYYRPLVTLSYHLQYNVFDGQPGGFHFANVMWNAIACVLVFAFLYLLFDNATLAGVTALLFALLPVHTESVAWVSGRTDVLATLWAMGSLLLYLLFRRRGAPWMLAAALAAFLLGLFAKESVVVIPVIALLLELPPLRSLTARGSRAPGWAAAAGVGGLFAMVAVYVALRVHALDTPFAGYPAYASGALGVVALPLSVLAGYTGKLLFPFLLSAEWDAPVPESFADPHVIAGAVVLLALAGVVVRWRHSPAVVLAAALFGLGVLPVLNIIPIGEISAERFLYFPSLGFALALGALLAPSLSARPGSKARSLVWVLAVIVVAYGARTVTRNPVWANEKALFTATVKDAPQSPRARVNLGDVALREGRVDDCIALYRQALEIDPDYSLALSNLAGVYAQQGKFDEAAPLIERAVRAEPDNAGLYGNLGSLYLEQGKPDAAGDALERAIALNPDLPMANYSLGRLRLSQKRLDQARAHFLRVVDKGHAYELSSYYLAVIEVQSGNLMQARQHAERFLQTHPRSDQYSRQAREIIARTQQQR